MMPTHELPRPHAPAVPAPAGTLPPGAVAGGSVRVEALVARRTSASVYAARHLRLEHAVALKVLAPGVAGDVTLRARFQAAVRAQAALTQPNIVGAIDLFSDGDLCGAVTELVAGRSLAEVFAEGGAPLSVTQIRAYMLPVVEALTFAHARGVAHGGLKPANVLLAPFGQRVLPRVTDFGLHWLSTPVAGEPSPAELLASLPYLPPELRRGDGAPTPAADVYAAGVIIYQMCSSSVPLYDEIARRLTGGDGEAARIARELADASPATDLPPGMPAALRALIERAVAVRPEDRFPSMAALGDALRGLRGVIWRATGVGVRSGEWQARTPVQEIPPGGASGGASGVGARTL